MFRNGVFKLLSVVLFAAVAPRAALAENWPQWRGPQGTGVAEVENDLPTRWNKTENIRWRVPLPEPGNSTPIVWENFIFVTQAVGPQRTLMCFDRVEGKLLWQKGTVTAHDEPTHKTNPYASASPVTDGERVVAFFASDGLFCYDFDGELLWKRTDLGTQIHTWGAGPSPVLAGDLCFINFGPSDVGGPTYLLAVDKRTGDTVWRHDEDVELAAGDNPQRTATFSGSWTTPVLMTHEGREKLLMSWPNRLAAYDPESGDELWTCSGLNPLVYTSPIYDEGIIVSMGGYSGRTIAVRAGGTGDVTQSHLLWQHPKTQQRIGSGVIKDGYIYIHNDPGIAECFELKTGDLVWKQRLAGREKSTNWSSIMLAGDHCYTINQGGDCFVFKASPTFELVSINPLGEWSNSSIVPSRGELFIRTHEALWCIGEEER